MGKDTITLPETQECTPLFCTFAVCIEPQDTVAIKLSPLLTLPADATGYLYADPSLDEGLIMLEGVQTTSDGNVTAWVTNTTNASMSIEAGEAIALWEPDMDGEFELADSLNNEVVLMVNALKAEHKRNKEDMAAARHDDRVDPTAAPAAQVRQLPTNGEAMMAEAPNTVVLSDNETMNSASADTYNAEDYE